MDIWDFIHGNKQNQFDTLQKFYDTYNNLIEQGKTFQIRLSYSELVQQCHSSTWIWIDREIMLTPSSVCFINSFPGGQLSDTLFCSTTSPTGVQPFVELCAKSMQKDELRSFQFKVVK